MDFNDALDLFQRTLARERSRPDVHAAMLGLAKPDTINEASSQIVNALIRGERHGGFKSEAQHPGFQ